MHGDAPEPLHSVRSLQLLYRGSVGLMLSGVLCAKGPRIADVRLTCFDDAVYEPAEARRPAGCLHERRHS